jgi:hypothetical protein
MIGASRSGIGIGGNRIETLRRKIEDYRNKI